MPTSEIHAIEFHKKNYPLERAKQWIKKHNYKVGIIHEKIHTLWFNQTPKQRYKYFIKKNIKRGINLVLGYY